MDALVRHGALAARAETAKERFPVPAYVHHVPGRLRLKAVEFRENPIVLEAACREVAALPGVNSVCPNRLTGSILVDYDPLAAPPGALVEAMQQRGFPQVPLRAAGLAGAEQLSLTERLAEAATRRLFEWLVERLVVGAIAAVI